MPPQRTLAYHPQSWRRRTIQATAARVLLFSQLLGTLHLALVQHVLCFEHGEAIEQQGHASPVILAEDGDAPQNGLNLRGPSQRIAERGHPHEHCLIQAYRRDALFEAAFVFSGEYWTASDAPCELGRFRQPDRVALLRVAPKQSPPAQARHPKA